MVERLWRSVIYEDIYLKGYATMGELVIGLNAYLLFTTKNGLTSRLLIKRQMRCIRPGAAAAR
jgi:hypothetical protein